MTFWRCTLHFTCSSTVSSIVIRVMVLCNSGMFNTERLNKMKKGAYLINNARGAIADMMAVKEACESGQLGGIIHFPNLTVYMPAYSSCQCDPMII